VHIQPKPSTVKNPPDQFTGDVIDVPAGGPNATFHGEIV
jgi:hypothetical protein